ncbi:hypothetical protein PAUR_a1930 [Pseudoalteromonas aurantia 208]|uniref:Orphan protein n=1 Tax=Pseudoalteromonas aurantia 208 TaxID=1314867 RepID=A0ABR9EBJ2_9GAMM|nr:hypothetical protein [Pseudoalteromonas aurantia 208]
MLTKSTLNKKRTSAPVSTPYLDNDKTQFSQPFTQMSKIEKLTVSALCAMPFLLNCL